MPGLLSWVTPFPRLNTVQDHQSETHSSKGRMCCQCTCAAGILTSHAVTKHSMLYSSVGPLILGRTQGCDMIMRKQRAGFPAPPSWCVGSEVVGCSVCWFYLVTSMRVWTCRQAITKPSGSVSLNMVWWLFIYVYVAKSPTHLCLLHGGSVVMGKWGHPIMSGTLIIISTWQTITIFSHLQLCNFGQSFKVSPVKTFSFQITCQVCSFTQHIHTYSVIYFLSFHLYHSLIFLSTGLMKAVLWGHCFDQIY